MQVAAVAENVSICKRLRLTMTLTTESTQAKRGNKEGGSACCVASVHYRHSLGLRIGLRGGAGARERLGVALVALSPTAHSRDITDLGFKNAHLAGGKRAHAEHDYSLRSKHDLMQHSYSRAKKEGQNDAEGG